MPELQVGLIAVRAAVKWPVVLVLVVPLHALPRCLELELGQQQASAVPQDQADARHVLGLIDLQIREWHLNVVDYQVAFPYWAMLAEFVLASADCQLG
jgi:hypothetical protein